MIEAGASSGMQTFEQSLLALCTSSVISEEEAMAEADSPANLRLALKQIGAGRNVPEESKYLSLEKIKQQF
jgi:Tfp pilus assembly ATPase PilU